MRASAGLQLGAWVRGQGAPQVLARRVALFRLPVARAWHTLPRSGLGATRFAVGGGGGTDGGGAQSARFSLGLGLALGLGTLVCQAAGASAHADARSSLEHELGALEHLSIEFPHMSRAELRRFLRSCGDNLARTEEKLRRNRDWRACTFPLRREDVLEDLRRGVLVQHGADRDGRPILIYFGNHYRPGESDVNEVVRAMVFTLEQATQSMPGGVEQVVLMIYTPTGAPIDFTLIRALSACFSENYPESLHRAYVLPAGPWARYFWSLIRWCFVEAVRDKVVLIKTGDSERSAVDIDPLQLPMLLGGEEDWVFNAEQV
ncbi:CRAL-TRIO domain-containing protein [Pavlovales sp. CCMP2436]|nr:CRAL-TRIO domain-containing protein [Pavlovales sp. CCMP2436]|mmetsp:Transcript_36609/g.90783  ORF Transcript_36609/g.90783 Transcript_36609/m.90783 type:complete len:318 (-) Transcript_36609:1281-2234(-)